MGTGGGDAHADEQPRPRRCRAPRRPRRLRRHRARGALLGCLRRDRPRAALARRRRDAAGPVGQAGRRLSHPRVVAAGADRELEPGRRMGELGRVSPPRAARPDHVRADDRGLVDLHREPGDRPGHLRVLRRDRPPALRRLARRHDHADRGPRRHGRRAAARGDHERWGRPVHRGRSRADPQTARDPIPGRAGRRPRRRDRPLRGGEGRAARAQRRSGRECRRGRSRAATPRLRCRRGHRPDLGPRPVGRLHPGGALAGRGR